MPLRLLFLTLFALASQASARSWINVEGGRAEDYRRISLEGGGPLDADEVWTLQGSLAQAISFAPGDDVGIRISELGAGLSFEPSESWDLKVDARASRDSTDLRYGGGELSLGTHTDLDPATVSLHLHGGPMHYALGTEESLRQNKGGAGLWVDVWDWLGLGLSGQAYSYDRDLTVEEPGSPGTPGTTIPGGLFGLAPSTTINSVPGRAGGAVTDPLLPGFPIHDWSMGLSLDFGHGAKLVSDYTQSELLGSGIWAKVVSANFRQELNENLDLKLGWNKAVEGGSDSPYLSLGLTWYFDRDDL